MKAKTSTEFPKIHQVFRTLGCARDENQAKQKILYPKQSLSKTINFGKNDWLWKFEAASIKNIVENIKIQNLWKNLPLGVLMSLKKIPKQYTPPPSPWLWVSKWYTHLIIYPFGAVRVSFLDNWRIQRTAKKNMAHFVSSALIWIKFAANNFAVWYFLNCLPGQPNCHPPYIQLTSSSHAKKKQGRCNFWWRSW